MVHKIDAVPDEEQNKGRGKVIKKMNVKRGRLTGRIEIIKRFKGGLNQGKEGRKQQGQDKQKDNLLVYRPQQKGVLPDNLPHTMRTDNPYFQEKQKPAEHRSFKLPENKSKKNVDKAKKAPAHDLERPISIQLNLHKTNVRRPFC